MPRHRDGHFPIVVEGRLGEAKKRSGKVKYLFTGVVSGQPISQPHPLEVVFESPGKGGSSREGGIKPNESALAGRSSVLWQWYEASRGSKGQVSAKRCLWGIVSSIKDERAHYGGLAHSFPKAEVTKVDHNLLAVLGAYRFWMKLHSPKRLQPVPERHHQPSSFGELISMLGSRTVINPPTHPFRKCGGCLRTHFLHCSEAPQSARCTRGSRRRQHRLKRPTNGSAQPAYSMNQENVQELWRSGWRTLNEGGIPWNSESPVCCTWVITPCATRGVGTICMCAPPVQ